MDNLEKYFADLFDCKLVHQQMVGTKCGKEYLDHNCNNCKKKIIKWLSEENDEPILTNEEKEWLVHFIKPFRERITTIAKRDNDGMYFIEIRYKGEYPTTLPDFENNKCLYRGMFVEKEYTLDELGLKE